MTDHPINLRAWEVRAFLEGRKTRFTRVLKLPKKTFSGGPIYERPDMGGWEATTSGGGGCFTIGRGGERIPAPERAAIWHRTTGMCMEIPHQPGDRLWCREALDMGFKGGFPICTCKYAADGSPVDLRPSPYWAGDQKRNSVSPIVMPRWASRLTLHVEAVKVCRVQDITEEEAIAEGLAWRAPTYGIKGIASTWSGDSRQSYAALWNADHGPGAFDRNDWVASYTVRVERRNIDKETT